jgi:hypothetical protein
LPELPSREARRWPSSAAKISSLRLQKTTFESAFESGFFRIQKTPSQDLEKGYKNPIFSTAYPSPLCARRMASFVAEIARIGASFRAS